MYEPLFGEWHCLDCGYIKYGEAPETKRKRVETLVRHAQRDDLAPLVIIPSGSSKHQRIGTTRCPWCWDAFHVERWMTAAKGKQNGQLASWRCSLGHYVSLIEKPRQKNRDGEWLWQ